MYISYYNKERAGKKISLDDITSIHCGSFGYEWCFCNKRVFKTVQKKYWACSIKYEE